MIGNSLSLGLFKPGKSVEVAIFSEYSDAPASSEPLPVDQLDLLSLHGLLLPVLGVSEDHLLVGQLQQARTHPAANLTVHAGILQEIHS